MSKYPLVSYSYEPSSILLVGLVLGAIAGGFIGASLSKKLQEQTVDRAFNAVQLLVLALAIVNIIRNAAG